MNLYDIAFSHHLSACIVLKMRVRYRWANPQPVRLTPYYSNAHSSNPHIQTEISCQYLFYWSNIRFSVFESYTYLLATLRVFFALEQT